MFPEINTETTTGLMYYNTTKKLLCGGTFFFFVHMYVCVQVNVCRSGYGDRKSTSSVFLTHISTLQSEISPSHWLTIMPQGSSSVLV